MNDPVAWAALLFAALALVVVALAIMAPVERCPLCNEQNR
jgi:hypothetical protein